jgi:hypothetical protein
MDISESKGWGRWLQSRFVLGTARKIYLVIASISLLIAILAFAAALIIQLWSFKPLHQVPVPEARMPQPVSMDSSKVAESLMPPKNVRFEVHRIANPLDANDVVGYFNADTPNGLAAYPNDFDLFGGVDAAQFERVPVNVRFPDKVVVRAGLRPTSALLAEINSAITAATGDQRKTFTLNVVSRDRFGNTSNPAPISFTLVYGGSQTDSSAETSTDMQQLARNIAVHLDPARTTTYFDQYRRAMRIPSDCGTIETNQDFVRGFGKAFDELKTKLNVSNIAAFYAGVCTAWREGVSDEEGKQQTAENSRNDSIAKNMTEATKDEISKVGLSGAKYTALTIVGSAICAFLFISLFLAFLAMENHSEALKQAVQAIAGKKTE